ncbi:MAG: Trk system potassium transporter TrkA [Gammaproteobacteria bacterium]|nr:Trk system potassium transporter TrkA [Gammaproteobacteria bacterium]MXW21630.1 Trk system potassium transporter TrkA [Gammaproteobacteria bacterium]MXZ28359.1 Trk system potassium transporter TrkA [Gammaproteobacteria bacterium]MYH33039.1 Trk system potassium transporter TrkA [Gammaproteobacteria bacterium]MYL02427.1 Trk system potassium transporter TrkA [Gammaproteobacteria bacterium]
MKILILGAGVVGSTIAERLSREPENEITIVDLDADILRAIHERMDVRTVAGHASRPGVLDHAGAGAADLVIAVTGNDEVNMVACQVVHSRYREFEAGARRRTKIARLRYTEYSGIAALFGPHGLPVDVAIAPEDLITRYVEQLVRFPGASQVLEFSDGRALLLGAEARAGSWLVGRTPAELGERSIKGRIAAVYRSGHAQTVNGRTVIENGDDVYFIAGSDEVRPLLSALRPEPQDVRSIMIAGGGNIGARVAESLQNHFQVKLIESSAKRARQVAERLGRVIVLHGDATHEELLIEENIERMDAFVALMNADEANLLAAGLAKRAGCKRVMALANRQAYAALAGQMGIDVSISPAQITISELLRHIRQGDVARVHSLRFGRAEAIEGVAHSGDGQRSLVGRAVGEINLPHGTSISAIVRDGVVLPINDETTVEDDDHVILFMTNPRAKAQIERLFEDEA